MSVYEPECRAAGLEPADVLMVVRLLRRAGTMADRLGVKVFGGSGSGDIRTHDGMILATIEAGHWDGGDGATRLDDDGLRRGE